MKQVILWSCLLLAFLCCVNCSNNDKADDGSNSTLRTFPVVNAVKRAAIVWGRMQDTIPVPKAYGVCISKSHNPTVEDNCEQAYGIAHDSIYAGMFGAFFDNLDSLTTYYARTFVTSQDGQTVYGNEITFKTTAGGTFSWTFTNPEDAKEAGALERITEAMDSALYYFRNYTNQYKVINVSYNPSVPTADCNILGNMRFGKEPVYQWVGTVQHELSHSLGVGQASNWNSFASPWNGQVATLTARVMLKDMSILIEHDTQHFWPGGINWRTDVTNAGGQKEQERMLKANAMIVNGMNEFDGLKSN